MGLVPDYCNVYTHERIVHGSPAAMGEKGLPSARGTRMHSPPLGVKRRRCGLLPNYFEGLYLLFTDDDVFGAEWRARGRRRNWQAKRPLKRLPTPTGPSWSPRTSSLKSDATVFEVVIHATDVLTSPL